MLLSELHEVQPYVAASHFGNWFAEDVWFTVEALSINDGSSAAGTPQDHTDEFEDEVLVAKEGVHHLQFGITLVLKVQMMDKGKRIAENAGQWFVPRRAIQLI